VLSGGEQQMLAIGRALMGRPTLICMDEPTMGLSPAFVDRVLELIQVINQQGIAVFMVEQNANLALQIAHRGYVLQNGAIVLQGEAGQLLNQPEIQDAYLGGSATNGHIDYFYPFSIISLVERYCLLVTIPPRRLYSLPNF
jgi:branched-chain amino acid transport system ATP-binding protein